MKKVFNAALVIVLLVSIFIYGIGVGRFKWFPWYFIHNIYVHVTNPPALDFKHQSIEDIQDINLKSDSMSDIGYWHALNPSISQQDLNSNISQENLNNFIFLWSRIEDSNIQKIADIKFDKDNLYYINQNDPKILSKFGLTSENMLHNAGIKSVFDFNGQTLAYIAYVNKNCATADLVSLDSLEVLFNFGCVNAEKVDLNGAGGAHLILSDTEFLLTTGTPTSSHVDNVINQNAQDENSYWGKILKFSYIENSFKVSVYSKGHRNPQGIFATDDQIFSVEHGPRGGDEINKILEGKNYGWPNQSFGSEYDFNMINKSPEFIKNYVDPLFVFMPSVGISYINECPRDYAAYYQPYNCLVVSSMRAESIFFIVFNNNRVLFSESINFGSRIRKFGVIDNRIIAITDYEGVIVGKIKSLRRNE